MLNILDKNYDNRTEIIGLTEKQASELLKQNGYNILAKEKKAQPVKIFFSQFKDVMIIILLAATVISVFLGEIYDAVTIILIVLINSILGFIQEYKTEKTLIALSRMTAPTCKCYRDGILKIIPANTLVKGDIIELEAGDKVPADAVIISSKCLFADEAILTGEAVAVLKCADSFYNDNLIGQKNIAYSGTVITKGHAKAKVIATGIHSQMGKISGMLSDIVETQTPLQKRLEELGKIVAIICIMVCIIVASAGIIRGENVFDMLLTGISIAIAAIPEGLPATVTIALALAVSRMLKQNALVHKLHSVETLGCTSVICTDKTGTITENKMTVTHIYSGKEIFDVSGNGYKISGDIKLSGKRINPIAYPVLKETLICSVLCNNATISSSDSLQSRERGNLSGIGNFEVTGDPTEIAFLIAAAKCSMTADDLKPLYKKTDEIPFDSETRCMTTFYKTQSGENIAFTKGALDCILSKCSMVMTSEGIVPLTYKLKKEIMAVHDDFTSKALRVLAFSKKSTFDGMLTEADSSMTFLGLIGMLDPPREEAKAAIKTCSKAHIKTVMITGDHKNTAVAIAKQAGILKDSSEKKVLTGEELSALSDEKLSTIIDNISVFARVNPSDKLRIVRAFKSKNHIVTMTGDGVNDAPAIKEAHIGVSMGITGTDVTKQASDVILLDDNFATLVNAVEQGRTIYANIRKFVRYLLSCNIGEVITMFVGILMGMPLVLLPTQILLVNLITDSLPAISLGVEPVDSDFMKRKPRSPDESFFSDGLMGKIIFRGILIGLCTLACFSILLNMSSSLTVARTGALFTLVMSQLLHVFECKSEEKNIFNMPYFNNMKLFLSVIFSVLVIFAAIYLPVFQIVFSTIPLNEMQLLISFGFSAVIPIINAFFIGKGKNRNG